MSGTILLADDSLTIQKVIELTFAETEYEVIAVSSGEDLLQKLPECRPDVIVCDVIMPGKDGYEVCQEIKSSPDSLHIPVILLTGTFEPFDRDRALAAGCSEIITKPFEARKLVETVERLLEQSARGGGHQMTETNGEPMGYEGQVVPPAAMPPSPPSDGAEGLDFTTTGFDEMEEAGRAAEDFEAPLPAEGLDFFDAGAQDTLAPPPPPAEPPPVNGAATAPVNAPFEDYDEAASEDDEAFPEAYVGEQALDHGPAADDDLFATPEPGHEAVDEGADRWPQDEETETDDERLAAAQADETVMLPIPELPELPEDDSWSEPAAAEPLEDMTEAALPTIEDDLDAAAAPPEPFADSAADSRAEPWEQSSADETTPWGGTEEAAAEPTAAAEVADEWGEAFADEAAPAGQADQDAERGAAAGVAAWDQPADEASAAWNEPAPEAPAEWDSDVTEPAETWDDATTDHGAETADEPAELAASVSTSLADEQFGAAADAAQEWPEEAADADGEAGSENDITADIELPEDGDELADEAPAPWADDEPGEVAGQAAEELNELAAEARGDETADEEALAEPTPPSPWEEPRGGDAEPWDEAAVTAADEASEPAELAGESLDEPIAEIDEDGAAEAAATSSDQELATMMDEVASVSVAASVPVVEEAVRTAASQPDEDTAVREPPAGELADADVERIARRVLELAHDTIERIAWEVIPDMAEIVVRERIRQLESAVEAEHSENRPH